MTIKVERYVLKEYLKIVENPEKGIKKFNLLANLYFGICLIIIFSFVFGVFKGFDFWSQLLLSFCAGAIFILAVWYQQAATQFKFLIQHISRDSVQGRYSELEKR